MLVERWNTRQDSVTFHTKEKWANCDMFKKLGSLETLLALLKGNKEEANHTLPDTALHEQHDCSLVTSRC